MLDPCTEFLFQISIWTPNPNDSRVMQYKLLHQELGFKTDFLPDKMCSFYFVSWKIQITLQYNCNASSLLMWSVIFFNKAPFTVHFRFTNCPKVLRKVLSCPPVMFFMINNNMHRQLSKNVQTFCLCLAQQRNIASSITWHYLLWDIFQCGNPIYWFMK